MMRQQVLIMYYLSIVRSALCTKGKILPLTGFGCVCMPVFVYEV